MNPTDNSSPKPPWPYKSVTRVATNFAEGEPLEYTLSAYNEPPQNPKKRRNPCPPTRGKWWEQ